MNDEPNAPNDPLAHLIHAAGRREVPPQAAYERVLSATTQVWQAKVRRRRWRLLASAVAGIGVVAAGTSMLLQSTFAPQPTAEPIAQVARVIGSVQVRSADAETWISLREDTGTLHRGAILRTEAASAAALRLEDVSVRIANDTEVVLESESRVRVIRGKIYIDTGSDGRVNRMLVVSEAASVSDVGTQFEVQYRDGGYRVRVREGEILLQRGAQRRRGLAGDQISIDNTGAFNVATVAANDPAWDWVHVLASAPDIDDKPLTVLLAWVARETGAPVRYATPDVERRATATILHGSIRHLAPLEALAVMLATTDLRHEVLADGTIMIK